MHTSSDLYGDENGQMMWAEVNIAIQTEGEKQVVDCQYTHMLRNYAITR